MLKMNIRSSKVGCLRMIAIFMTKSPKSQNVPKLCLAMSCYKISRKQEKMTYSRITGKCFKPTNQKASI
jgi:hypothetical protein